MLRNTNKLIAFVMISSNPSGFNNDHLFNDDLQLDEVVNQVLVSYATEWVDFYNQLIFYIHPIGSFKTSQDYEKNVIEKSMKNMINFNARDKKLSIYLNRSNRKPFISFVNHFDQSIDFNINYIDLSFIQIRYLIASNTAIQNIFLKILF